MNAVFESKQFKKDRESISRTRGGKKILFELYEALSFLIRTEELPPSYSDHALKGDYNGYRDLHLRGDIVLIYKIDGEELLLARLGTHNQVFA